MRIPYKAAFLLAALVLVLSPPLLADIRGTDINGKPVILRSNGTWSYISPPPNKTSACQRYTDNALAQQRANLKYKCGFAGPRWHQDYSRHYNWCMRVDVRTRGAATIARRDALNQCIRDLKASACRNYANTAIAQQRANLKRKCGFTGIRWHQNYATHYNWCMQTKAPAHASETAIRRNALARCGPKPPPPPPGSPELSCRRGQNMEKGCCCFKGAHTYTFAKRQVGMADVTFDTGKGVNCRSLVKIEVRQAGKWRVLRRVGAVSSRGSSESAPMTVSVGVHGMIDAIRVGDGCVCCIDDSRIRLR